MSITAHPSTGQLRLPGPAAAPDGPVDLTMMWLMHHGFRRDLNAFVARRTPSVDVSGRKIGTSGHVTQSDFMICPLLPIVHCGQPRRSRTLESFLPLGPMPCGR